MTTSTTVEAKSAGLGTLAFARRFTEQLLEGIPQDKITFQPFDGANHVLWNVGHLAWTDDHFLKTFAGQPSGIPETWSTLFGMGSEPVDDPGRYPSYDEVKAVFEERRRALTEWISNMDDAKLAEPLPEDYRSFAENHAGLIGAMAAHECMHNGQIGCMRKAMGLERRFG